MRKSTGRSSVLGSKAQAMLGLGPNSKSRILQVQRQGYLFKKPFSKSLHGAWQKRYFVLKDSFLFWYSSKPTSTFDMYPAGCLPLGGCSVFPMGKEKDGGFVFEVSHPDFDGNVLQLKSKDKAEVDDWIKVLQDCSKATWHNAMLGDALIQKMKHAGTTMEKETESALQEARRNAEEFSELRQQKVKLMEEQLDAQRKYEEEILREKEKGQELEHDLDDKEQAIVREKREQEEENTRMEAMARKLEDAYKAIKQLEVTLERRQRTDLEGMDMRPDLQQHIDVIKRFMEDRHGSTASSVPSENRRSTRKSLRSSIASYD